MNKIKVFSDFSCPYCYIGISIVERLKEENPDLEFEFYPYFLDTRIPLKGLDISKFTDQEKINKGYERIESLGEEYGLKYENKSKRFNTIRLHQASLYAKKEDKFIPFAKAAFRHIFELGKNVGEALVVNEIGLEANLNIVEMNTCIDNGEFDDIVSEAKEQKHIHEIESVPTFIMEDRKVNILKAYEEIKKEILGL